MAFTWKKVLTEPSDGSAFSFDTTGAVSGLSGSGTVSNSQGGYGQDMSTISGVVIGDGAGGFSGVSGGSVGDVLTMNDSGGLSFSDPAAFHSHGDEYVKKNAGANILGSLHVHGNFECNNFNASSYNFSHTASTVYTLNSGVNLGNNTEYGFTIDDHGGSYDWNLFYKTGADADSDPGELIIGKDGSEDNLGVVSTSTTTPPTDSTAGYIGEIRLDTDADGNVGIYICDSVS